MLGLRRRLRVGLPGVQPRPLARRSRVGPYLVTSTVIDLAYERTTPGQVNHLTFEDMAYFNAVDAPPVGRQTYLLE